MDAKLDGKRLEELAARCAVAIDGVGRNASYGLSANDLRALARCAAAWAKVERLLQQGPIIEIRNTGKKRVVESRNRLRIYEDTVVEAVEASPEATDAK